MRRSQSFTLQQYLPCTAELEGAVIWWQKLQKVNKEPPSLYIRCKQKEWKTESKVCLSISHFSKSKNPQYNFSQKPSFHLSMPVSLQNWNFDFSSPTNKRITFCRGQKKRWLDRLLHEFFLKSCTSSHSLIKVIKQFNRATDSSKVANIDITSWSTLLTCVYSDLV